MTTVRIGHFRHRTVLPASVARPPVGPQMERSLDALLALLPAVIDDIGLPPSTVVCVRSLRVRLSVGTQELTDVALFAQRWAETIAGAIENACTATLTGHPGVAESADGDVVVFRNQAAALADLVQCVAFADRRRQWAWQQAGLGSGDHESPAAVVVAACLLAPAYAIPVLAWAAGRQLLDRVVLTWPDWHRLAAGLVPDLPSATASALPSSPEPDAVPAPVVFPGASPAVSPGVLVALVGSPLAAVVRETVRRFGEPARLVQLAVTALALRAAGHQVDGAEAAAATWSGAELNSAATVLFASDRHHSATATAARSASSALTGVPLGDLDRPGVGEGSASESPVREADAPAPMLADDLAPAAEELSPSDQQLSMPEQADVWTAQAGLLFCLNLVALQHIVAQARRHERGMEWCLLALGARLAGCDQADAAVRVFAALPTGVRLPAELTTPPDDVDERLLDAWVARCDAELAQRLRATNEPDALDSARRNVIRRVARLLIDPGWIEAEFPFDTVDVAIRRAGLDLDPGAVRHLGCVVRFRYV